MELIIMSEKKAKSNASENHQAFLRDIMQNVRRILAEEYKLKDISVLPISAGAARLSNPIKIMGRNKQGEKVRYFGKVIGNNDILTVRYIQFLKNIYLQMYTKEPIFEIYDSVEDMVRDQYEMMQTIYKSGIPAIKPYGYHLICNSMWLLVAEYIDAKPFPMYGKIDPKQVDTVFSYLKTMHQNKIYHGDIKPENIILGKKIYVLDAGHFRKDAPEAKKEAYDLACMISSFLENQPVEGILKIARNHFSRLQLQTAAKYIELIQLRPDIHFTDETKKKLLLLLKG